MIVDRRKSKEKSLIVGASGVVGSRIVKCLSLAGERPFGLSRNDHQEAASEWIKGDLADPSNVSWPEVEVIYCTAGARLLANALPTILTPALRRVVLFTTTSISTKANSSDPQERAGSADNAAAEQDVIACCDARGVKWTVLRPTIIYDENRDENITRLARLIERFGFFPLCGMGRGLRQPVHAEDCAIAAISTTSSAKAENKIYNIPGTETITYREMIGRIFDGMKRPRVILPVPPFLWLMAFNLMQHRFPGITTEMGVRMAKDMTFDPKPAFADFGWSPRPFKPSFS
jgi:nucleoside-diphosphate-sugar epimerase